MISPIENDPLPILAQAAYDLYGIRPKVDYIITYEPHLEDEKGALDGVTDCPYNPGQIIEVKLDETMRMVSTDNFRGIVDSFVHELGHVVTGCNDEHDQQWGEVVVAIRGRFSEIYWDKFEKEWKWPEKL